jgi:hypothetical protein
MLHLGIEGMIIKRILKAGCVDADWIKLDQEEDGWWAIVKI